MTHAVEYQADSDWVGMLSYTNETPLTAAGIPVKPPKQWFDNPQFDRLAPLTVTSDGQVYGHVASWSSSHIGRLGKVRPPRSRSNYAYFRTGTVETEEGDMVPVGQITLTGGHAPLEASAREAVAHYDNTHSAIMDVAAGEDAYGIWVAGALRPDVDDIKIRAIRASSYSGDWRPIENSLEMVAICAVNVPGFPIPRALAASAEEDSEILALVAAGTEDLVTLARRDPLVAAAEYVIEDIETKVSWLRAALAAVDVDSVVAAGRAKAVVEEPVEEPVEQQPETDEVTEEQVSEGTGEVSEGIEVPADGTEHELVIEDASPVEEPPEPVETDDDGESDSTMAEAEEVEEEEDVEFTFTDSLSAPVLAQEIADGAKSEILWKDNLPLQFSTEQAEAVAVRLKFRNSQVDVDPSLRAQAAEDGAAMPDGRLPLLYVDDVLMALQIVPQDSEYFEHVLRRAKEIGITDLPALQQEAVTAAAIKQKYSFSERLRMVKTGEALVGGAFPIRDEDDLRNAVQSVGRAKDPMAAKSHLMRRARALNLVDALPEKWSA